MFTMHKFKLPFAGAINRSIDEIFGDIVTLKSGGAIANGTTDDAAKINSVLSSGRKVIDGGGLTYKINSSITVPDGVTLQNATFQNGTAGMNAVLFGNKSKIKNVAVIGTGTTNIYERGFYPSVDGVYGAELDVEVSNLTIGVHLQPLNTLIPHHNRVVVYVHDIVGVTNVSEGYGVLCSPANDNEIFERAYNIKRHGLYLSAGASRNFAVVDVDTCYHHCGTIYSTAAQDPCENNEVHIRVRNSVNASGNTGFAVGFGLAQKANRNRIFVDINSDGNTDQALQVAGVGNSTGPWPTDNVIHVKAAGNFLQSGVCQSIDADNTIFDNPVIVGKGTSGLIQFQDSSGNTYTPKRAGSVRGGMLNGVDSTVFGVLVSSQQGIVEVEDVPMYNVAQKVKDYIGNHRIGKCKTYNAKVTFANVADQSSANQTITLPENFENITPIVNVTAASSPSDQIRAVVQGYSANSVTVYVFNKSGVAQASIEVSINVEGD